MGAGAVAAAGVITLAKTLPTIWSALRAGIADVRAGRGRAAAEASVDAAGAATPGGSVSRVERDLPMRVVLIGVGGDRGHDVVLADVPADPGSGDGIARQSGGGHVRGGIRVFVCDGVVAHLRADRQLVESDQRDGHCDADGDLRRCSSWWAGRGGSYAVLALTIGGVVCIAAANGGGTSQDLKTGFLVGATPSKQQTRADDRRDGVGVCRGRHAEADERGPGGVQAGADRVGPGPPAGGTQVEQQNYPYQGKELRPY